MVTKAKVKVTSKYGGKKIDQLLKLHGTEAVRVGVLKGAGVHPGPRGKKRKAFTATIAEIAWWNEFGTSIKMGRSGGERIVIPERPFLRWTMKENDYYRKHMQKALFKAMTTRKDPVVWLKKVASTAARDMKGMIRKGAFEPNAPATIRKKSTSSGVKAKPLIDTGTLYQSIQWEVESSLGV